MDRDFLLKQSQTAQVRIFTENLLQDGSYHSRKEIVQYIEQQRQFYNLPEFRSGHIAGGIQQATVNCERLGRGNFRIKQGAQSNFHENSPVANDFTRAHAAVQIINDAIKRLADLARQIDFVEADEEEMKELDNLKNSVQELKNIKKMWETD